MKCSENEGGGVQLLGAYWLDDDAEHGDGLPRGTLNCAATAPWTARTRRLRRGVFLLTGITAALITAALTMALQ
ncbi:hypothetical protein [Streptomyces flavofungini]|uniref:hypothetical protein n=1 Tax=Streptomyces flavofungini TaxID=68200 RepID=UPI0034DED114